VLFAPQGDVPATPYGVDKVVHAALFAAQAFTARWAGVGRGVAAGLMVLWAAVSEALQGTDLVGRDASLGDWLADVVGVLVGLLLWRAATAVRR
jgi:VanZ family protein